MSRSSISSGFWRSGLVMAMMSMVSVTGASAQADTDARLFGELAEVSERCSSAPDFGLVLEAELDSTKAKRLLQVSFNAADGTMKVVPMLPEQVKRLKARKKLHSFPKPVELSRKILDEEHQLSLSTVFFSGAASKAKLLRALSKPRKGQDRSCVSALLEPVATIYASRIARDNTLSAVRDTGQVKVTAWSGSTVSFSGLGGHGAVASPAR